MVDAEIKPERGLPINVTRNGWAPGLLDQPESVATGE